MKNKLATIILSVVCGVLFLFSTITLGIELGIHKSLNNQIEQIEQRLTNIEDKLADLEIRVNCLEGKHIWNTELDTRYSWSADYSICSAIVICINCENEYTIKTAPLDESKGYAEFETEGLEKQYLINATNMKPEEVETAVKSFVIEKNVTTFSIALNETDEEKFPAIQTGLSSANDGAINLTLLGVKTLPLFAFSLNKSSQTLISINYLNSICLPNVTSISDFAFMSCSGLTTVDIPLARNLSRYAFEGCSSLTTVNMPLVRTVGLNAFYECTSLEFVDLPSATTLQSGAFSGCKSLESVNIPNVTTIEDSVFDGCNITELNLENVTSIGNTSFVHCGSLVKITFATPVTSFGKDNFYVYNDLIDVDTTKIDLVFTSGQKNFEGDNTDGWTLTDNDIEIGENVTFAGYTFKSITVI